MSGDLTTEVDRALPRTKAEGVPEVGRVRLPTTEDTAGAGRVLGLGKIVNDWKVVRM